jgi:hypothetical protein
MRLLSFDSNDQPCLTPFSELEAPQYAVLSHTWGPSSGEITFAEILGNSGREKAGYRKIEFCRNQAQAEGIKHFWIDTCCIDKSSSAELSKAINSMFALFRNAKKCFVYLADVSMTPGAEHDSWEPEFRRSRWFSRGWTLQELLAPRVVEFFSREGQKLGDKKTLAKLLHEVTDIPLLALQGLDLGHFPIQERFRWAAKRHTTEPEDKAYSLLGIFKVFIPPIYGEGEMYARRRLQEAIEAEEQHAKQGKQLRGL